MPSAPSAAAPIFRHAEARLRLALTDSRIVALVGPRQSGKTTLVRKIAADRVMNFVTLDDEQFRQIANDDPGGFVRDLDRAVIDGVQRAPALIPALKKAVDEDPRPGRFLITGSVDLFKGTISPDSLAGRVETLEFLPFSQAEIERRAPSGFLTRAFEVDFVLERAGRVVGLEVKAATSVRPEDFHGLKRLQEATGKAFACGIILHDGERIQRTGDRFFAMPVQQLWT